MTLIIGSFFISVDRVEPNVPSDISTIVGLTEIACEARRDTWLYLGPGIAESWTRDVLLSSCEAVVSVVSL